MSHAVKAEILHLEDVDRGLDKLGVLAKTTEKDTFQGGEMSHGVIPYVYIFVLNYV